MSFLVMLILLFYQDLTLLSTKAIIATDLDQLAKQNFSMYMIYFPLFYS